MAGRTSESWGFKRPIMTEFPRVLPGEPLNLVEPIYEPFEVDEGLAEQMRQLLPSVTMMAISLIPFSEVVIRKTQRWLNRQYPENLTTDARR